MSARLDIDDTAEPTESLMNAQTTDKLSSYRELKRLDASGKVVLLCDERTGQRLVRKKISLYSREVYSYLMEADFPGIPKIYDCTEAGEELIVLEEYVEGTTLRRYLNENGPFPEKEASRIICELCEILIRLHEGKHPVVGRDLKPENIILTEDLHPVIIDFDSAKFVRNEKNDTMLLGTPGYAAPEQYGFGASDERTDIYAVGVILNEMLTGCIPMEQTVKGTCGRVIRRCTNLDPQARPKTLRSVLGMLGYKKYLPPGFRTGQPTNMTIGAIGYIANAWFTWELLIASDGNLFVNPSLALTWLAISMWTVLYGFDYLEIRTKTPLIGRIQNIVIRAICYGIVWVFVMFALIIVISAVFQ